MSLLCISVLLELVLKSFKTPIVYRDVESNPGSIYVIEKAICDSYHQGDSRFGDTADVQHAC